MLFFPQEPVYRTRAPIVMDGNYKDKVKTISTLPFTECFRTSLLSVPAFIPIEGQSQHQVNLNDKISSTSGFHGKFCPTRYVAIFIGFAKICKNIGRSHRVGGVACCWKFPSRPVSSAAALLSPGLQGRHHSGCLNQSIRLPEQGLFQAGVLLPRCHGDVVRYPRSKGTSFHLYCNKTRIDFNKIEKSLCE